MHFRCLSYVGIYKEVSLLCTASTVNTCLSKCAQFSTNLNTCSELRTRPSTAGQDIMLHGIDLGLSQNHQVKLDLGLEPSNKIVVEYSSPNIAKPFHVGHLRSTIIGNFISNIEMYLSNSVQRINYLGDWGTQFGFLKVGLDLSGYTSDMVRQNPIQLLYEAYVMANQKAESDPSIATRAREVFQQLEEGSLPDLQKWETFRGYTVDELQLVYKRLGVAFDEYNWESSYGAKDVQDVLNVLEEKGILKLDHDGRKVVEIRGNRYVTVVKSDGSTLYLTRDIAAAIDRFTRHNFDEMLYVVDNAQTDHFMALFSILSKMDLHWASRLRHIKFGRIRGMSTRKGTVVFLKDILDEMKEVMFKKQQDSATTKVFLGDMNENTADVLGVSALLISDLRQRRQHDYKFDWNRALKVQGDTGVSLQYTHCRLWNLENNCGASLPVAWDYEVLQEPQAKALIDQLKLFSQILRKSQIELEACILVNYLFRLCHLTSKALKCLQIKNQDAHIGSQRLLLFHNARHVLNQGMRILGLQPLNEM